MEVYANIIFVILFIGLLFITGKIVLDSNFEKCFKQGRINSIRIAYFLVIIIISFLVSFAIKEFILSFMKIFN